MQLIEVSSHTHQKIHLQLLEFEHLFEYPLRDNKKFRIDHGPDYTAFYTSIGQAKTIAMEHKSKIIGTLSIAQRTIS